MLSQTNKYYYKFDEFKEEQEYINRTKQNRIRDIELFNIKTSVEVKKCGKKIKFKTQPVERI